MGKMGEERQEEAGWNLESKEGAKKNVGVIEWDFVVIEWDFIVIEWEFKVIEWDLIEMKHDCILLDV